MTHTLTLTHRQIALWKALTENERQSVRELAGACEISSVSVVAYNLNGLRRHGIIEWPARQARSIRLLQRYEDRHE